MFNILFVSAFSEELNIVKKEISKNSIPNLKIKYFSGGAWNYNTILNLTRFLEKNKFDFIINIWICWFKKEKKDFFQVSRIFNYANKKELIVPYIIDFWDLESIFCSETIVYDKKILDWENFVDMESFAFEKVCDAFSVPRLILKVPVDKIWNETRDFPFLKAKKYLKENINYKKLLEKILVYLEKNFKKEEDFSKYFKKYNFSFSEKEIFKKLFYAYKALIWDDFPKYFEKNHKNLDKKTFLEELRKLCKKIT